MNGVGVVCKRIGTEPLPKAALRRSRHLGYDELSRLGRFLEIEELDNRSRSDLLVALAEKVDPGDEELKETVCETGRCLQPTVVELAVTNGHVANGL